MTTRSKTTIFIFLLMLWSLLQSNADSLEFSVPNLNGSTNAISAGFANQLFNEGDYYRAITEYKRELYFSTDDDISQSFRLRIGQALFLAGQYNLLIDWYASLDRSSDLPQETLLYGRSLFSLGRFDESSAVFDSEFFENTTHELQSQAFFYAGLSYVRLENSVNAITCFRGVNNESVFANRAGNYVVILESNGDYQRKDPLTAGLLGVFPGAGYAYTEHYGTALASLALNGLLAWATIDAFQDGDTAAGITFSIFASGFYIGNITGSVQSANNYNEYQSRLFQAQFSE